VDDIFSGVLLLLPAQRRVDWIKQNSRERFRKPSRIQDVELVFRATKRKKKKEGKEMGQFLLFMLGKTSLRLPFLSCTEPNYLGSDTHD
jgi:hypothetical protein